MAGQDHPLDNLFSEPLSGLRPDVKRTFTQTHSGGAPLDTPRMEVSFMGAAGQGLHALLAPFN